MSRLGLASLRQVSWARGAELIDEIAHCEDRRLSTVVVTPAIEGWTLVAGLCWWAPLMRNLDPLTDLCKVLSERFGKELNWADGEEDDKLKDWTGRRVDCLAIDIAAESSLDPTAIGPAAKVSGLMLVADAPAC